MGFYDREYYREEQERPPGLTFRAPRTVVAVLVIINAALWIGDFFTPATRVDPRTLEVSGHWLSDAMAVHAPGQVGPPGEVDAAAARRPGSDTWLETLTHPWLWWQLLTYGFAHSPAFGHVLGNMIGLWFLGRDIESTYGRREFLRLYLVLLLAAMLRMTMPQWQVEDIGPSTLLAGDDLTPDATGRLSIPLAQQANSKAFELSIRARQKIPDDAKQIELKLPQVDNARAPTTVEIQPADNVELIPRSEKTSGLVRQQYSVPATGLTRQQQPLCYSGESQNLVFAADFRVHPQAIRVSVINRVELDDQKASVEQRFVYTISHEAAERLAIDIPRSLAGGNQVEILLDGKPTAAVELLDPDDRYDPTGPVRRQVVVSRIGACELVLRYSTELEKLASKAVVPQKIPLVMPCDGTLQFNRARISAGEGLRVSRQGNGPWTVHESDDRRFFGLELEAAERVAELPLGVCLENPGALRSTVVTRAWIQTCLMQTSRLDRAVFNFTTARGNVELKLPEGTNPAEAELWLDGQKATGHATSDGRVILLLPDNSATEEHRLETIYRFAVPRPEPGAMQLELPQIGRDAWVHRLYWELVLPSREHVIVSPTSLTSEYRWSWNSIYWGRRAILESAQLEAWCGAQRLSDVSSDTNRYLFSSLEPAPEVKLRTDNRLRIMLVASGLALVAGLLVIYVPASRHPAVLLTLAIALGCMAISWPEPTLLIGQASSLGVALAILAGVLRRALGRRTAPVLSADEAVMPMVEGSRGAIPWGSSLATQSTQPQQPVPPMANSPSKLTPSPSKVSAPKDPQA